MIAVTRRLEIARDEEQVSNGGREDVLLTAPYRFSVTLGGDCPILFHRWDSEAIAEKAAARKGSDAKKQDNIESYVYRTPEGLLGVPGGNFQACLREAGRYMPDPRSPRKSAMDLIKAGCVPLDGVAAFTGELVGWDYDDRRRVTVQRQGVARTRPALNTGWSITFVMLVTTPEYLGPEMLRGLIGQAGRLIGLCDYRPTYGRFSIANFAVLDD